MGIVPYVGASMVSVDYPDVCEVKTTAGMLVGLMVVVSTCSGPLLKDHAVWAVGSLTLVEGKVTSGVTLFPSVVVELIFGFC